MLGGERDTQAYAAGAAVQASAPAAAGAPVDGAAVQAPTSALDEKTQAFWRSKLHTANFGGAVALFMRSPARRHYTLADLEWCLLPALRLNQFMAAEVSRTDRLCPRRLCSGRGFRRRWMRGFPQHRVIRSGCIPMNGKVEMCFGLSTQWANAMPWGNVSKR
jgi:hypothetical protein